MNRRSFFRSMIGLPALALAIVKPARQRVSEVKSGCDWRDAVRNAKITISDIAEHQQPTETVAEVMRRDIRDGKGPGMYYTGYTGWEV